MKRVENSVIIQSKSCNNTTFTNVYEHFLQLVYIMYGQIAPLKSFISAQKLSAMKERRIKNSPGFMNTTKTKNAGCFGWNHEPFDKAIVHSWGSTVKSLPSYLMSAFEIRLILLPSSGIAAPPALISKSKWTTETADDGGYKLEPQGAS